MTVLKRWWYLEPDKVETAVQQYMQLRYELSVALSKWLEVTTLQDWPNGESKTDNFEVSYSEWKARSVQETRLFQAMCQTTKNAIPWRSQFELACEANQRVIATESWELTRFLPDIPYKEIPNLLSSLGQRNCRDEDGLMAGRIYSLSMPRVQAFVEFLKSVERKLPVVVVTPTRKKLIASVSEISRRLSGIAHVVRLKDGQAVAAFRENLPKNHCYGGAIRMYWPNFKDDDLPQQHPLWRLQDQDGIKDLLFGLIAKQSPRLLSSQLDIERLKQSRRKQYDQSQTFFQKGLEAVQQKLAAERSVEEMNQLLGEADKEISEKNQFITELEEQLDSLQQECRELRWRVNQVWQQPVTPEEEAASENKLFLSTEARKVFDSLDEGEQRYWKKHILSKLLTDQLRAHQSEVRNDLLVFPRKKTGDGRRLFYFIREEEVYVCELFLTHDDYDKAHRKMKSANQFSDFERFIISEDLIREDEPEYLIGK